MSSFLIWIVYETMMMLTGGHRGGTFRLSIQFLPPAVEQVCNLKFEIVYEIILNL